MSTLLNAAPELLSGLLVTIEISLGAGAVAAGSALLAGCARLQRSGWVRTAATAYVEFFRGTSALVQLFWLFFALPLVGVTLAPMTVAIGGLGLCMGAYGSEIVRAAVLAVPSSQTDAAWALGLTPTAALWHVVVPQALASSIPSIGNLAIDLIKLTSLVSLITLHDLTFEAQSIASVTMKSVDVFGFALIAYYLLTRLVIATVGGLERRRAIWLGAV